MINAFSKGENIWKFLQNVHSIFKDIASWMLSFQETDMASNENLS